MNPIFHFKQMMRKFVVGTLLEALSTLYTHEIKRLQRSLSDVTEDGLPKTIFGNFINALIRNMHEPRAGNNREYTEYFEIFARLVQFGEDVAHYMLKKRVIGRLLDFFYDSTAAQ
jgi:hypothetical protein